MAMRCRGCKRPIESPEMAYGKYLMMYSHDWSWRLVNPPTDDDLTCGWNYSGFHEPLDLENVKREIAAWL